MTHKKYYYELKIIQSYIFNILDAFFSDAIFPKYVIIKTKNDILGLLLIYDAIQTEIDKVTLIIQHFNKDINTIK